MICVYSKEKSDVFGKKQHVVFVILQYENTKMTMTNPKILSSDFSIYMADPINWTVYTHLNETMQ